MPLVSLILDPIESHVHYFGFLFLIVELMIPKAVDLSVSVGIGECWWTIFLSVVYSGIMVFPIWKSTPSLASTTDAMKWLITRHLVWSGLLSIVFYQLQGINTWLSTQDSVQYVVLKFCWLLWAWFILHPKHSTTVF